MLRDHTVDHQGPIYIRLAKGYDPIVTDPALVDPATMPSMPKVVVTDYVKYGAGIAGALLVLVLGKILVARQKSGSGEPA